MKRKTIATMILVASMMMNCMPAMAASNLANASTTLNKVLNVDENATVPGVTFNFEITPGTADEANNIRTGVAGATISNAVFTQEQTTTDNKATSTVTVDFTGCDFLAAGVYRYVITETAGNSTNNISAFTNDTKTTRWVDVYVENDDNQTSGLKVAGYVVYSVDENGIEKNDNGEAVKSTGYENTFHSVDLGIKNATEGNMGDKTKQFAYKLDFTEGIPGSEYTITIYDKDGKMKESRTITIDEDGKAHDDFTLADGEYAEIPEIAAGTKYSVTAEADGYNQTKEEVEGYKDAVNGTLSSDKKTSYTHKKEGTIPTGVIMTIAPFAGVALVGAAGVVLKARKKREDDEE